MSRLSNGCVPGLQACSTGEIKPEGCGVSTVDRKASQATVHADAPTPRATSRAADPAGSAAASAAASPRVPSACVVTLLARAVVDRRRKHPAEHDHDGDGHQPCLDGQRENAGHQQARKDGRGGIALTPIVVQRRTLRPGPRSPRVSATGIKAAAWTALVRSLAGPSHDHGLGSPLKGRARPKKRIRQAPLTRPAAPLIAAQGARARGDASHQPAHRRPAGHPAAALRARGRVRTRGGRRPSVGGDPLPERAGRRRGCPVLTQRAPPHRRSPTLGRVGCSGLQTKTAIVPGPRFPGGRDTPASTSRW